MNITWIQIVWATGLFLAWNGFLVVVIKWLLSREVSRFETGLSDVSTKTAKVAAEVHETRLQISQKPVCNNHFRMENDNNKQFELIAKLNGNIQKLTGKIDGLANSMDLLLQHHIKGG